MIVDIVFLCLWLHIYSELCELSQIGVRIWSRMIVDFIYWLLLYLAASAATAFYKFTHRLRELKKLNPTKNTVLEFE